MVATSQRLGFRRIPFFMRPMPRGWIIVTFVAIVLSSVFAQQSARPEAAGEPLSPSWCRNLPRPGYRKLERVEVSGDWFEVYRIRPGVLAIYEPHQYEEVISYL